MTRLIVHLYLLDFIVLGVCADHSTVNCVVNTIMSGDTEAFSFPHPMDSNLDIAILGDGEVRTDPMRCPHPSPLQGCNTAKNISCVCAAVYPLLRLCCAQHCIKAFRKAVISATEDSDTKGSRIIPIEVLNDKGEPEYITVHAKCLIEAFKFKER